MRGTKAMLPPNIAITAINKKANGISTSKLTVAEVINSRKNSNECTVLVNDPTELGRKSICSPINCSKVLPDICTSIFLPAASIK